MRDYPQDACQSQMKQSLIGGIVDINPTVEEIIDKKISILKVEIARLEAKKIELAPLMKMRIRDIREAISF